MLTTSRNNEINGRCESNDLIDSNISREDVLVFSPEYEIVISFRSFVSNDEDRFATRSFASGDSCENC